MGMDTGNIMQFNLSSNYDISSASFYSDSYNLTNDMSESVGFTINSLGDVVYVASQSSVYKYILSTPWDIKAASLDSLTASTKTLTGLSDVSPDESKLYATYNINDNSENSLLEMNMATPGLLSTLNTNPGFYNFTQDTQVEDIQLNVDGTKLYMLGYINDSLYQYTLSTPWDLSTASYDSISFNVSSQDTGPRSFYIRPDGAKLYMLGDTNDRVHQYTLSTPWDLSTISYDSVYFSLTGSGEPTGNVHTVRFNPDGTKMYINRDSGILFSYTLSTPWDVTSAAFDVNSVFPIGRTNGGLYINSFAFNSTGDKVLLSTDFDVYNPIFVWELTTPWSFDAAGIGYIRGLDSSNMCISRDGLSACQFDGIGSSYGGLKMIVWKRVSNNWEQYASFSVSDKAGVRISNDGKYIFQGQSSSCDIYEDQLDGTYNLIDTIAVSSYISSVETFSISANGDIAAFDNVVFRRNGSVWDFEQVLRYDNIKIFVESQNSDFASYVVPDGSRIICSPGLFDMNVDRNIQAPVIWKYNTSSSIWEVENSIDLSDLNLNNTFISDEYNSVSTSSYFGADPWDQVCLMASNDDGSRIVINYALYDSIRSASFTTTSGALVFEETSPGNWEFLQRLRISTPMRIDKAGIFEGDRGHMVAMNSDGNRVLISHFDSDFTQGGGHGKIDIYDWNSISGEYEFIDYVESLDSWYGDSFAANIFCSGDGSKVQAYRYGSIEDGDSCWHYYTEPYTYRGVIEEYDIGLPQSRPAFQFKSPRFYDWKTDINVPYIDRPDWISPYTKWANRLRGGAYGGTVARVARSAGDSLVSMLGYNTGKFYAELYFTKDKMTYYGNKVTNPEFLTDSDWTKGVGWSISNGKASCDGTQASTSDLTQTIATSVGYYYNIIFAVSDYVSGTITPYLGTTTGQPISSNGLHQIIITASSTQTIVLRASSDFIGSIDSIIVEERTGFRFGISYSDYASFTSSFVLGPSPYHSCWDTRGAFITNNNQTFIGDSAPNGIIGIAVDIDSGEVWYSFNGTWIQGDPSTGVNPVHTLSPPAGESDYINLALSTLNASNIGRFPTFTQLRVSSDEFEYPIPTGFSPWDPTTSTKEYGYPAIIKYDNPTYYWRPHEPVGGIIPAEVGDNDLIVYGDSSVSAPIHTFNYGFHKIGALALQDYPETAYIALSNEIIREASEPFTITALVYFIPDENDLSKSHGIFSSGHVDVPGDEFILQAIGRNDGRTLQLNAYLYNSDTGQGVSYNLSTTPRIDVILEYYRWFHISVISSGNGTFNIYVDGATVYYGTGVGFPFISNSKFRCKYIGTKINGYIADAAYWDRHLALPEDWTVNGVLQNSILVQHAGASAFNYATSFGTFPPVGWDGPNSSDDNRTSMLSRILTPQVVTSNYEELSFTPYDCAITPLRQDFQSNYDEITITPYDSLIGPTNDAVYGPYSFASSSTGDVNEFLWTDPITVNASAPPGGNRHWAWDSNDTASSGVGPTSGQGGNPEGYVYTESSSPAAGGDEFFMEFNTTIDTTSISAFYIEFYTNQRGNDNNATCQVQINEGGGGWTNVGPEFGGPDDPDKVASSGTQIWSYRNVDLSAANNVDTRVRIKVKLGTTGTIWHNDYGIDTVTITVEGIR